MIVTCNFSSDAPISIDCRVLSMYHGCCIGTLFGEMVSGFWVWSFGGSSDECLSVECAARRARGGFEVAGFVIDRGRALIGTVPVCLRG